MYGWLNERLATSAAVASIDAPEWSPEAFAAFARSAVAACQDFQDSMNRLRVAARGAQATLARWERRGRNRARLAGNGIAYPFDHPED